VSVPLSRRPRLLIGLLALAAGAFAAVPSPKPALAQPVAALPPHLAAVPADAAFFVHANVAAVWDTPAFKSIRAADPTTFTEMAAEAKKNFGMTPDQIRTATLFIPKVEIGDAEKLALILTFSAPFDKAKMQAGITQLLPAKSKFKLVAPNPTTAVVLVGLDDVWADARPANKTGPLSDAIRAAATGTHAVVLGTALANLPAEVRGDNLPDFLRAFSPILKADAVTATIDAGKDFTFDVRVKATTPGQAIDAEKALGVVRDLVKEEVDGGLKDLQKQAGLKEVVALAKAFQTGLAGAKFSTDKSEARAVVAVPAGDLPFGAAWVDGIKKVRDAATLSRSANNLKQLALAMHNYESTYQSFPPAAVCDKTGKPLLSWRVLILPYIEQDALFKQFKLDEPWDSDHNKKLLDKMPKVFSANDPPKPGETTTHYRVFVGNGAGFDYLKGPTIAAITDGTSNTWMIATAADAVPWTKPDELPFDPEKDTGKLLGAVVGGRIQVAMFDGSVRNLAKVPGKKLLNALVTRGGGEVVVDDD
jgi:hypothetical protein